MPDRDDTIARFLAAAGWDGAAAAPLAGDASARRYLRMARANDTAVLMDAAPDRCGSIAPFLHVGAHLAGLGVSVPGILASDAQAGLILLEDLGDATVLDTLVHHTGLEQTLYLATIDVLAALRSAPPPNSLTRWDAAHMADLLRPAFEASPRGPDRFDHWRPALVDAFAPLDDGPRVFCHRDFHAGNLFWLPDREGVARIGVIDFQDAFAGPAAYDLVSLITDARRDLAPDLPALLFRQWLDLTGTSDARLQADLPLLIAQRNLRVHGVLSRLARTGKPHYAAFLPRVRRHLGPALAAIPSLAALAPEVLA
jgi:aminoglycoside/choline kinase family phosphotransferase